MALSREEQRVLNQMEAALAAEDPRLEKTLHGTRNRRTYRLKIAFAGAGLTAAFALLVVGMSTTPILSVLGYVFMVAAAVTVIHLWQYHSAGKLEATLRSSAAVRRPPGTRWSAGLGRVGVPTTAPDRPR